MGEELEAEVRDFILACGSVAQLEVLLLLRRDTRAWSAAEVATELRIEASAAALQLAELEARGLLAVAPVAAAYRFSPAHAERRVSVIGLIYSQPASALRQFADAFRLRRTGGDRG